MVKHRPPSRIRYEKENPCITFRLTKDVREILDKLVKEKGLSYAGMLRDALSNYADAYNRGFEDARKKFEIVYHCTICSVPITIVAGSGSHKEIVQHLRDEGWGHSSCHNKRVKGGENYG